MKGYYVKYTTAEDHIITGCVRKMPYNLQMAFERAGSIIKRTKVSVEGRYYNRLRYKYKMFYIQNVEQINQKPYIMSKGAKLYNVKNIVR